jgi:hypothetical protein
MIAIAALAWLSMSVQQRVNWLALWGGGLTVSVLAYYVLLK